MAHREGYRRNNLQQVIHKEAMMKILVSVMLALIAWVSFSSSGRAGEMKAEMEKAKGQVKGEMEEAKGEARALKEEAKGNDMKAAGERAKGNTKGAVEKGKGKVKELNERMKD
jgi:hypothetical protein